MKKSNIYIITLSLLVGLIFGSISLSKNYVIEAFSKENSENTPRLNRYDLKENIYINNDIKIKYPQIVNLTDKEKQEGINKLIKDKAISAYDDTLNNLEKGSTYEVDGSYDIKLANDKILSIAYDSFNNVTPSAHPFNMFYTTNINIETGKELTINDFISNFDEKFINELKHARYVGSIDKIYEKQLFDEIFSYYSNNDELIKAVKAAPFYINGDSIGISLPASHVFGDYANLEIEFKDLK